MVITSTQVEIYATTKQLMDLCQKYLSLTLQYEKIIILDEINTLYKKIENLGLQLKDETK